MRRLLYTKMRLAHDDQGGQAFVFLAIVLFALVCFFALVINVGHRVTAKVEMQNAADAVAMSGGIWNARGLNVISVLNVGMTECLAFIIMFKAFDKTYIATKVALEANKAIAEACSSVPYIGIICKIWNTCLKFEEKLFLKVAEKMNKLMKKLTKKNSGLWKVMKVLEKAEGAVKIAFPVIAAYEANRIAELNGADPIVDLGGFTYSGLFFPTDPVGGLPVKKGKFKDLCKPTTEGGSGYKNFLCWDSALAMEIPIPGLEGTVFDGITKVRTLFAILWELAFVCVIPPPGAMWEGFVELSKNELCGGSSDTHSSTESTTSCRECDQKKGEPTWSGRRVRIDCKIYNEQGIIKELGSWENADPLPQGQRSPCSSPVSKSDPLFGSKPCTVTCIEKKDGECYKSKWVLKGCTYQGKEENVQQTDTSKEAKPLMLKPNWEDQTKYTAIVKKNVSDQLHYGQYREGGESFGVKNMLGDTTWAVAQVEIYNPTQADLFNQDWHVKLKPCRLNDLKITFMGKDVAGLVPASIKKVIDKGLGQGLVH